MVDAISAAVAFMSTDMTRMTVIGQNLANISTSGYRSEIPVSVPFTDYLSLGNDQAYVASLSSMGRVQDFRPGRLQSTGNPLDFAIEGDGFFEIMTGTGSQFTRQGNFQLDSLGRIVNQSGMAVAGDGGEILVKSSQVRVDAQGRIFEADRQIGQLRVTRFSDPRTLVHLGGGMYMTSTATTPRSDGVVRVRQGFLESSNVNSTQEMVRMIETMRHFEAGQKVIQAYDDMLGRAFTKLGDF
jgi:flagellar basal-body rod protein FlgG